MQMPPLFGCTFRPPRALRLVATWLTLVLCSQATTADAQSFGRNKVQYDHLNFEVLPSAHFDLLYYPPMGIGARDAAHMAERWYERHSALLGFQFKRDPIILYADPPDFQQSNVVEGLIGQGTGGVTEGNLDRVIMPLTGIYANTDHVLGHELVHVFQYRIAADSNMKGVGGIERIPLWLIEGMAEYLSLGRHDANTAMWLRDAALRNDLPTIDQLTNDSRYFPYRYGQALWAYVGGRWGDAMVNALFRSAVRRGWSAALKKNLGMDADSLSKEWHAAIRAHYADALTRSTPGSLGRGVVPTKADGDQNVAPAVSPDGKRLAFFSSRNLFGIDLYVASMADGHIERQLTSVTRNAHYDALSFIASSGTWSSDGARIAIVVNAGGDEEIDILNATSGDIERRIHVDGVGSITDPAWSADNRFIAFSGLHGGLSDLYVYDLQSGTSRQLTNDREAQIQPAWSPDGTTLAFATDAGPATRFDVLTYGPMHVALIDVATGERRNAAGIGMGKAINPQWSPDGKALYFVSDADGVSDVYRLTLGTGAIDRITRIATGVSGITSLSPTLSVSRSTGDLVFSVFDHGGFAIRTVAAADIRAVPFTAPGIVANAGDLPPMVADSSSLVERSLSANMLGLNNTVAAEPRPYSANIGLSAISNASLGGTVGSGYGTGVAGGISAAFSDLLGNNTLYASVQANGSVLDVGAEVLYLNRARRLTWGGLIGHSSQAGIGASYADTTFHDANQNAIPGTVVTQYIQRQFVEDARGVLQYPLSATRRFEFDAGVQRIEFRTDIDSLFLVGQQVIGEQKGRLPAPAALTFGNASLAYVGDYSFDGFTSPIAGARYRVQVTPYVGSLNYAAALIDYRHYFFFKTLSFAVRGMHYGRYGGDAENALLQPLYIGQSALVRGYDAQSFGNAECTRVTGAAAQSGCPEFDRLNGSRIAIVSAELRIPLLGTDRLGLINFPYVPTEIAPFFDAGTAWTSTDNPVFKFARQTTERVPVMSVGVAARFNLFGAAIIEFNYAHPFQRPGKRGVFGFQLSPGW